MKFVKCVDDSYKDQVKWGIDSFLDDNGNEIVLTSQYGAAAMSWRLTDEEANAIAAELGVK